MLTELYCTSDDFCKLLEESLGEKKLIGSVKTKNKMTISISEILTIALFYHYSDYKNFKSYYLKHVKIHLKHEFPSAPSYSRIVELKQDIIWILALFVEALSAHCTGISIIDSTSIEVCHSARRYRNKTFKGMAKSGKTSVKWFFGFKMFLIINQFGQIVSFYLTAGNVADNNKVTVKNATQKITGKLIADRGFMGRFSDLYQRGIFLIHGIKSKMKNVLMSLFDKFLLKNRGIVETVFGILKTDFDLEHSRHRSIKGFFVNIFTAIAAYSFRVKKPAINMSKAMLLSQS